MKTTFRSTAVLAVAIAWVVRAALPVQADDPRGFPGPNGMAGCQGQACPYYGSGGCGQAAPYATGEPQSYGPYADPNAYGPSAPDGCGPDGCGPDGCPCGEQYGHPFLAFLTQSADWRFSADAVFLQRGTGASQTLFRDNFGLAGPPISHPIFQADDLPGFNTAAGFGVSAMRCGAYGFDMELAYTEVDGMQTSGAIAGNAFLQTDSQGGTFTVLDPQINYTSQLRTAEANLWYHTNERLRVMLGLRWLEFDDHYNVDAIGSVTGLPVTLENLTANRLFGGQIGADYNLVEWGRFTMNWWVKAGVYSNHSNQNSHEVDTAFVDESLHAAREHAAFMGEMGMLGKFEVIFDRLYLRGGYRFDLLDGVLLAPEQIAVNQFPSANSATGSAGVRYSSVFLHGAFAGLELRF